MLCGARKIWTHFVHLRLAALKGESPAKIAIGELRTAVAVLQVGTTDLQGAAEAADRAERHLRAFNKAAGEAIRR
jgi:hypothetical protein